MKKSRFFPLMFHFLIFFHPLIAVESNFQNIRQLIEYLQTESILPVLQEPVYNRDLLMEIYESNNFKPLWDDKSYALRCIEALAESNQFGLLPQDYHVPVLDSLYHNEITGENPQFDVLLTDGLLLYAHHLLNGKLNPRDFFFTWNFPQRTIYQDSIQDFLKNARKGKVLEDLKEHHPSFDIYWQLVKERAKWMEIDNKTDEWDPIMIVKAIKPGDSTQQFGNILNRLKQLEYLPEQIVITDRYDSIYLSAVINFQRVHGLDPDGVIGSKTIQYLNMSIKGRIQKIDVNLERLRWLSGGADENMVFVNIAGFHLTVVKDKSIVWDTPVMTGAVDTQTPVFTSQLKYLVFNPSWTVPRGILYRSLFDKMKADPSFITKNNYSILDGAGNAVDPLIIKWDTLVFKNFRYTVVQNPGPGNAMGVVKFMFPNQYSIYLHDTPSKSLFSKSARAFSNGCIRVKDPLILAQILLNDENRYNAEKIKEIVDSRITRTVFLKEPVTILLVYFTVDTDQWGGIVFHDDIYRRDQAILNKLRTSIKTVF
jgi:murein L,D-transpeptidase YcbB/YkuD